MLNRLLRLAAWQFRKFWPVISGTHTRRTASRQPRVRLIAYNVHTRHQVSVLALERMHGEVVRVVYTAGRPRDFWSDGSYTSPRTLEGGDWLPSGNSPARQTLLRHRSPLNVIGCQRASSWNLLSSERKKRMGKLPGSGSPKRSTATNLERT